MRLYINLIDNSVGKISLVVMQIFFLSALSFLLSPCELLETGCDSTLSCIEESVMKIYESLVILRGDAFPGGKEEGWMKVRGCAWFASLLPGITSKENITQKSPIKGQACWVIAQRF